MSTPTEEKPEIVLESPLNPQIKYGALEGPLKTLIPVFIDFETFMTHEISLKRMTLRQYMSKSHVEMLAIAIGRDEPEVHVFPEGKIEGEAEELIDIIETLAQSPDYIFVAHNAAFDIRVLRYMLGLPQPVNVWCTMEGSMGAWPELPGGYSLANIPKRLKFPPHMRKTEIDLLTCTDEEKEAYNKQDVKVMQEVYYRQIALLPACEQEVAIRTHRQRQFHFEIATERLNTLIEYLKEQAGYAEKEAEQYVGEEDAGLIFGREDSGDLKSVRPLKLRKLINTKMGGGFNSTSLKKISPLKLAANPKVAALLAQTSRVSKMLSHKRRSSVFRDVDEVDVELGVFRAHTFRFSSPSVGKGLNLHNIPKHDKAIAEPVRKIYRLPANKCFVRGDLSNVEYRIEGKLTGCKTVLDMFDETKGGNMFNDPYCEAWGAMTNQKITKKDPIRQVAKAAVLGLGFCMGPTGYARQSLLTAMADKTSGVSEEVLKKIALELHWTDPSGDRSPTKKVIADLGCSYIVALAAYSIHKSFNRAHPEFSMTAEWLWRTINSVASCATKDMAKRTIERAYEMTTAPDPSMLTLSIDTDGAFSRPSVRVACGPWVPTVCWREPKMRPTDFSNGPTDLKLTVLKATGQFKPFTKQLAIENVTQAAARNSLCWGVAKLDQMGWGDCLHIHDEILLIVDRKRETILAARDAMVSVFGPGSCHPLNWACLVKPSEISVTESIYESEDDFNPKKGNRWGRIEENTPDCLENLP